VHAYAVLSQSIPKGDALMVHSYRTERLGHLLFRIVACESTDGSRPTEDYCMRYYTVDLIANTVRVTSRHVFI
jgi:hypothetical protein